MKTLTCSSPDRLQARLTFSKQKVSLLGSLKRVTNLIVTGRILLASESHQIVESSHSNRAGNGFNGRDKRVHELSKLAGPARVPLGLRDIPGNGHHVRIHIHRGGNGDSALNEEFESSGREGFMIRHTIRQDFMSRQDRSCFNI